MTSDITGLNVAVLAGGWSDERDVSMSSGREVCDALREAGFENVTFLDVAGNGFLDQIAHGGYDVAFVALHGEYGEDGCMQGLLEVLRIPYTFSGVQASAMAMDKWIAKGTYQRAGIPTPAGVIATEGHADDVAWIGSVTELLGMPMFVKPASNGSSFGITRVTRKEDLPQAIRKACDADKRGTALVEEGIAGTEVTVPVIGNGQPVALPVIEIVTGAEFYDSTVKYEPSELHHVIPARVPRDALEAAQALAARAHKALGCRGCSRSDFIIDGDGSPVILETNTIPGMTAASLLPDSARHAGIPFPALCRMFVEMAIDGHGTESSPTMTSENPPMAGDDTLVDWSNPSLLSGDCGRSACL